MNSISDPFIKRPVMTMLVYASIAVAGVISYLRMPVSDLPDVEYPIIQVNAVYPGASPDVVAANVATPLEQQFLQIPGIEVVTSSSSQGFCKLVLQFQLSKSIDAAAADVQAAINAAQGSLPADLPSPPTYQKTNPNAQPIMYLGVISYSMPSGQLYDYVFNEMQRRIQLVPGVSSVQNYGAARAVRIQVDPDKLYTRGLTFNDISDAVRRGTTLMGAGQIEGGKVQISISPKTQLEKASDYAELIIAYKNGAPVRLRDIAECVDSVQEENMRLEYGSKLTKPDGTPLIAPGGAGLVLAVTKAQDANAVRVASGVRALLPELRKTLPPSIVLYPIYDRSLTIINSVIDVAETLAIAFVLVVLVVFLFLGRVADTAIPVVALPMSLLMTFIVMRLCGFTIDNLSLMALTLAIGFLIDDAIVFLENMVRRMEAGEGVLEATFNGAKEISFTILAMTLSLAAVFIPLIGMGGVLGRVFFEFGITIIVAVIASGIVSLTLTPMMCSRLLKPHGTRQSTFFERVAQKIEHKCLGWYGPWLKFALKHWYLSVVAYALCFLAAVFFMYAVPKSFLPMGDSGFIFGIFQANTNTAPAEMRRYQDRVDEVLRETPAINNFVSVTGLGQFFGSNRGVMFMTLTPPNQRKPISLVAQDLAAELGEIPGITTFAVPQPVLQISAGATDSFQADYAFVLSGLDKRKVYEGAEKLAAAMRESSLFMYVQTDLQTDNPELQLKLNREAASAYNVPAMDFALNVANAYAQNYSYLIKSDTLQYWVIVEAAPGKRAQPEQIDMLHFQTQPGPGAAGGAQPGAAPGAGGAGLVPFRTVATAEVKGVPLSVNHFNGFASVTLMFGVMPNANIDEATKFIEQKAAEVLPADVTAGFQGKALMFQQVSISMGLMAVLAIFVMYVILGILYESYIHPLTVLSSLPVALVGGLGTLFVVKLIGLVVAMPAMQSNDWNYWSLLGLTYMNNSDLSLYGWIGLFMLMGIVKKNGIMMIDFALQREAHGMAPRDAVYEACLARFRPIIMTTLAAFFGALPMVFGLTADAAARIPLGLTICGGLAVSQLVTLFITPVTYLGFDWVQTRVLDRIPFFARGERDPGEAKNMSLQAPPSA